MKKYIYIYVCVCIYIYYEIMDVFFGGFTWIWSLHELANAHKLMISNVTKMEFYPSKLWILPNPISITGNASPFRL